MAKRLYPKTKLSSLSHRGTSKNPGAHFWVQRSISLKKANVQIKKTKAVANPTTKPITTPSTPAFIPGTTAKKKTTKVNIQINIGDSLRPLAQTSNRNELRAVFMLKVHAAGSLASAILWRATASVRGSGLLSSYTRSEKQAGDLPC